MTDFSKFAAGVGDLRHWGQKGGELPLYKDKVSRNGDSFLPRSKKSKFQFYIMRYWKKAVLLLCLWGFISWVLSGKSDSSKLAKSGLHDKKSWKERQNAVKDAFKLSWNAYEKNAWGYDVYSPVSKKGKNMGPKPLGWIIVDSLDTLMIMGLDEELEHAKDFVVNDLDYNMNYEVNTFETTIRMLGGLLSAYYISQDDAYLDKATDLGNRLMGAFNSPSGIPYASVNLKTSQGVPNNFDRGASSTAEAATLQLEFKYLSKVTGEALYWEAAEKVMKVLDDNHAKDGLVPIYIHPDTGKFTSDLIRLGSRGDSYYEYLIKQYLQTRNNEPLYLEMYAEAVRGIKDRLVLESKPNHLKFIAELPNGIDGPLSNKMDHLVCFIGGMLSLGATEGEELTVAKSSSAWDAIKASDLDLAEELTKTCYETYARTATGLAPEIVVFNTDDDSTEDFTIKFADRHNLQRPETVESLFYLWRITKNPIYREMGWKIFQAFMKHTLVSEEQGFTSLKDVTVVPPPFLDNMESFWLSETLKYLYLLFDDSEILPLTDVVFNTEAHPFPKFDMDPLFTTGWKRTKKVIEKTETKTGGKAAALKDSEDELDLKQKIVDTAASKDSDDELELKEETVQSQRSIKSPEKVDIQSKKGKSGSNSKNPNIDSKSSKDGSKLPEAQKPSKPLEEEALDAVKEVIQGESEYRKPKTQPHLGPGVNSVRAGTKNEEKVPVAAPPSNPPAKKLNEEASEAVKEAIQQEDDFGSSGDLKIEKGKI